jgi:pyruvate formate lyase activating enzyme
MKGLIFSVKRYSIHDGPGIRVTFFLKGCPLSCLWCHNPEGISPEPENVISIKKIGEKEFEKEEVAGQYYSTDEVLKILGSDRVFIDKSGGGVTFSGGEPMLQTQFLLEVLEECKRNGFHTAVDTSGYSSSENFKAVIPFTDLFLFDIKHLDEKKHIELTGVSNVSILENFRIIVNSGKDMMIRIPVIPGYNDDQLYFKSLRDFITAIDSESIRKINLLPYHRIGSSKYKRFNIQNRMDKVEQPSVERMKELKDYFEKTGIKVKIGG